MEPDLRELIMLCEKCSLKGSIEVTGGKSRNQNANFARLNGLLSDNNMFVYFGHDNPGNASNPFTMFYEI